MKYIIDNLSSFTPADGVLQRIDDDGKVVVLTTTPCRIFVYLLNNINRIITREELLDVIWTQYGLQPSGSSLNQYIHLIRKSLLEIGHTDEIIKTIPKAGFLISNEHTITQYRLTSDIKGEEPDTTAPPDDKKALFGWSSRALDIAIIIAIISVVSLGFGIYMLKPSGFEKMNSSYVFKNKKFSINSCEVYSLNNISSKYDELLYDKISEYMLNNKSTLSCEAGAFFLFYSQEGYFSHQYGRFFIGKCLKSTQGEILKCDSIYEHKK